jgi:hypothetical protein
MGNFTAQCLGIEFQERTEGEDKDGDRELRPRQIGHRRYGEADEDARNNDQGTILPCPTQ